MFLILVRGRTFLFDCAFDDELDEYPECYMVYELENFRIDALPHDWTELPRREATCKGRIPVHSVLFDATKRRQVQCMECRALLD